MIKRLILFIFLIMLWPSLLLGANWVTKVGSYKQGTLSNCDDGSGWTVGNFEAAVDATSANDTLYVCAGTHTNADNLVDVDKTLTITGEGVTSILSGFSLDWNDGAYDATLSSFKMYATDNLGGNTQLHFNANDLAVTSVTFEYADASDLNSPNVIVFNKTETASFTSCTFLNGDAGVMCQGGDCDFTSSTFTGDADVSFDDAVAYKSFSGGNNTTGTITDCTFTNHHAMLSIGSANEAGTTIGPVSMTGSTGSQCKGMVDIRPGLGAAASGGTISNITVSDCTLTTTVLLGGGGVVHIDTGHDADGTDISSVSIFNLAVSAREESGGSGENAFIKIDMNGDNDLDTLNGLTISDSAFDDPGSGNEQIERAFWIDDPGNKAQNITVSNVILTDASVFIDTNTSATTDEILLDGILINWTSGTGTFSAALTCPFQIQNSIFLSAVTFEGSDNMYDLFNNSINGAVVVDSDLEMKNVAGTSTLTVNSGDTVTAAANFFGGALTETGTYTDGTPSSQFSTDPKFIKAGGDTARDYIITNPNLRRFSIRVTGVVKDYFGWPRSFRTAPGAIEYRRGKRGGANVPTVGGR